MIIPIAQKLDIYPDDGKHQYARTGELSISHLKKAGAKGVLLGHSEVGESAKEVNEKFKATWEGGLRHNIILLGEQWEDLGKPWNELDDKRREYAKAAVKEKLTKIIEGVREEAIRDAVFSYEPGWSVRGSGKSDVPPAQPEQIESMAALIRNTVREKYDESMAASLRIVYGGSMSPQRADEIMPLPDIDGFILGSAGTTTAWVKEITMATATQKKQRTPVVALNWKAYTLAEPYEKFIDTVKPYVVDCDFYLAPAATELFALSEKLKA